MSLWPVPSVKKNSLRFEISFLHSTTVLHVTQCSYLVQINSCATCMAQSRQCLYDLFRDRRRKAHTAELLNFRVALSRMAAKLRSRTPEMLWLIQEIRNPPTDQDALHYLVRGY